VDAFSPDMPDLYKLSIFTTACFDVVQGSERSVTSFAVMKLDVEWQFAQSE
jgi:hypothetical protein